MIGLVICVAGAAVQSVSPLRPDPGIQSRLAPEDGVLDSGGMANSVLRFPNRKANMAGQQLKVLVGVKKAA